MNVYIVMEHVKGQWDMPRGAFATKQGARLECKRLAKMALDICEDKTHLRYAMKKFGSGYAVFNLLEGRDRFSRQPEPGVGYHIEEFEVEKKGTPFTGCYYKEDLELLGNRKPQKLDGGST